MSFTFRFNFSFSLSLGGPPRNKDAARYRHAITEVEEGIQPTYIFDQQQLEAVAVTDDPELESTIKPAPSFSGACLPKSNTSSVNDISDPPIPDTPHSKAHDRESLKVLLRSCKRLESPTVQTPPFSTNTPDQRSNSPPVQISPITVSTTLLEDPFTFSPTLPVGDEDDSGSDLVSSLQRLRVGGLAAYFQELDERACRATSPSPTVRVSVQHDGGSENGQEEEHADHVDYGEWEEVVEGEVEDGEHDE